jgi:serine phosphatase RsbU (regulator of sigma subunit)
MYGRERFIEVIQDTLGGTAEQTIDAIIESVMAFCHGAPQLDDITLVAAKRNGA